MNKQRRKPTPQPKTIRQFFIYLKLCGKNDAIMRMRGKAAARDAL